MCNQQISLDGTFSNLEISDYLKCIGENVHHKVYFKLNGLICSLLGAAMVLIIVKCIINGYEMEGAGLKLALEPIVWMKLLGFCSMCIFFIAVINFLYS